MQEGVDSASVAGNHRVDWKAVKADGKSFVFLRATYGTYVDSDFNRHWPAIKAAGLVRGAYAFWRPLLDPVAQADTFIRTVGVLQNTDMVPILDLEFGGKLGRRGLNITAKEALDRFRAFRQEIVTAYGKCGIYTSNRVYRDDLDNIPAPDLSNDPLWLADYVPPGPDTPKPWGKDNWWVHQYAGNVKSAGFPGVVDFNRFNVAAIGDRGDRIKWLQRKLGVAADGIFGKKTEQAVKLFQAGRKLVVDGVVGIATWTQLSWL